MSEVFLSSEEERRILQTIAEFKASGRSELTSGSTVQGVASDRTIDKIYSQLEELKFDTKDIEAALTATKPPCSPFPTIMPWI